jgi:hypothetical protein
MKPTFAIEIENIAKKLLVDSIYKKLQLMYAVTYKEPLEKNG